MRRVEAALAERERRTLAAAARVLKEIARIAFADIRRYLAEGPDGITVRPLAQLSDDDAAAVAEIRGAGQTSGPRGVKLHDKRAALELLSRHLVLICNRRDIPPVSRGANLGDSLQC